MWAVFNKMVISLVFRPEHSIRYIGVFSEDGGWLTHYEDELIVTKTSDVPVEKPKAPAKQKSKKTQACT